MTYPARRGEQQATEASNYFECIVLNDVAGSESPQNITMRIMEVWMLDLGRDRTGGLRGAFGAMTSLQVHSGFSMGTN